MTRVAWVRPDTQLVKYGDGRIVPEVFAPPVLDQRLVGDELDTLAWDCYVDVPGPRLCPDEIPVTGDDCFGFDGSDCPFPIGQTCSCDSDTGVWTCGPEQKPLPPYFEPPDVPPRTPMAVLTDDDRLAFCTWYATAVAGGPGATPVPDSPVGANGYTSGVACVFGQQNLPCNGVLSVLSEADCEANLAVSECGGAVEDLTMCIDAIVRGACSPLERSCRGYFASTYCSGTIATQITDAGMACDVRVQ